MYICCISVKKRGLVWIIYEYISTSSCNFTNKIESAAAAASNVTFDALNRKVDNVLEANGIFYLYSWKCNKSFSRTCVLSAQ